MEVEDVEVNTIEVVLVVKSAFGIVVVDFERAEVVGIVDVREVNMTVDDAEIEVVDCSTVLARGVIVSVIMKIGKLFILYYANYLIIVENLLNLYLLPKA